MGKKVRVEIVETGKHFMKGKPVTDSATESLPVQQPHVPAPLKKGQVSGMARTSANVEQVCLIANMNSF